jgi:hypothetical protein
MTFGAGVVPRSNAVDTACAFVPALDVGMAEEAALRRRLCIPVGVHLSRLQFESNLCLSSSALASLPLSVRLAVPKRQSEFLAGRLRASPGPGGRRSMSCFLLGGIGCRSGLPDGSAVSAIQQALQSPWLDPARFIGGSASM